MNYVCCESVEKWGVFEARFQGRADGNPLRTMRLLGSFFVRRRIKS